MLHEWWTGAACNVVCRDLHLRLDHSLIGCALVTPKEALGSLAREELLDDRMQEGNLGDDGGVRHAHLETEVDELVRAARVNVTERSDIHFAPRSSKSQHDFQGTIGLA